MLENIPDALDAIDEYDEHLLLIFVLNAFGNRADARVDRRVEEKQNVQGQMRMGKRSDERQRANLNMFYVNLTKYCDTGMSLTPSTTTTVHRPRRPRAIPPFK